MQYEKIILELMSRIKVLEEGMAELETRMNLLEKSEVENKNPENNVGEEQKASVTHTSIRYGKTTEEMMDACYEYGKRAHQTPGANVGEYAEMVVRETEMNQASAIMYIYAVWSMIEGVAYKRAINNKATKKYFERIYREFGKTGLKNALKAAREHVEYRKQFGHPVESIVAICNEYEKLL